MCPEVVSLGWLQVAIGWQWRLTTAGREQSRIIKVACSPSREDEVVLSSSSLSTRIPEVGLLSSIPPHSGPSVHAGDITAETIRWDYDSLNVNPTRLFISPEQAFITSNMGSWECSRPLHLGPLCLACSSCTPLSPLALALSNTENAYLQLLKSLLDLKSSRKPGTHNPSFSPVCTQGLYLHPRPCLK